VPLDRSERTAYFLAAIPLHEHYMLIFIHTDELLDLIVQSVNAKF
jgi:hypothetical protein